MFDFYEGKRLPLIIAEIGINHNGDMDIAKGLIRMAKEAGCDYVKFQKRTIDIVYTQEFLNGPRKSPWGTTQREQKEGLEFSSMQYAELDAYCREVGIPWFASAWDIPSFYFLEAFDPSVSKIASAMITNPRFVSRVAMAGHPTFISTGMSTYAEIDEAVRVFRYYGTPFTLMHTVSTYPCKDNEVNLNVIRYLRARYKVPIGYSGHETGLLPSVLAASIGAVAIERHVTMDRCMYGSDQAASLERRGLEYLVRDCKSTASVMGDGVKRITEGERKTAKALRYWREE